MGQQVDRDVLAALATARIEFTPCDGFGDAGRTATLLCPNGQHYWTCIGTGHGETDDEAVVEALMDAGMSWDEAFDFDARAMIAHARVGGAE